MGKSKELAELGDVVTQSGGNVGISTSSPNARLEVEDAGSSGSVILKVTADDSNPYAFVVGNDTFSTTDTNGLAMWMGNDGQAKIDARGTGAYHTFRVQGTERMRIDASGRVTMPYQPAFRAFQTTDPTTDRNLTAASGVNWSVQYNRGNHFSDGTFTAPVDGVYAFSVMWDALAALSRLNLLRNGSAYASWEPTGLATASWESHYYGSHVYLSASDYVYLELVNSSGSNPAHMGGGFWGHFSGYLVG